MDELEIDGWSERIEDLLFQCDRQSIAQAELIRQMHDLLDHGPRHICADIRPDISPSSVQMLLDVGAYESAALRLLDKCSYMLSRSRGGVTIGTVKLPLAKRDYSYSGFSEGVALCGALATALQQSLSPQS